MSANPFLHEGVHPPATRKSSDRKPVILTFVNLYLPGYRGGGPARSIANLVQSLGDEFEFRIVTSDRDPTDEHAYAGVKVDAWNNVGKAWVFYASRKALGWRGQRRLLRETPHDILYLNSYFHRVFTLIPLSLRWLRLAPGLPLVIAPRGEFSPGALGIKPLRKHLFIACVRRMGLYRGARWQASTVDEVRDIQRELAAPEYVIQEARNLISMEQPTHAASEPTTQARVSTSPRTLRVCFLSRISEKKNLDFALRILMRTRADIIFNIYGPIEDAPYWVHCKELIAALPSNIHTHYRGSVEPARVHATIAAHDLLFVPTRGENFGHVFMEAWSAGVPVLTSDRTPWRDLQAQEIGWNIQLGDEQAFVDAMQEAMTWDAVHTAEVRAACLAFATRQATDPDVLDANRRLFRSALAAR